MSLPVLFEKLAFQESYGISKILIPCAMCVTRTKDEHFIHLFIYLVESGLFPNSYHVGIELQTQILPHVLSYIINLTWFGALIMWSVFAYLKSVYGRLQWTSQWRGGLVRNYTIEILVLGPGHYWKSLSHFREKGEKCFCHELSSLSIVEPPTSFFQFLEFN